jgi:hypothetical protein
MAVTQASLPDSSNSHSGCMIPKEWGSHESRKVESRRSKVESLLARPPTPLSPGPPPRRSKANQSNVERRGIGNLLNAPSKHGGAGTRLFARVRIRIKIRSRSGRGLIEPSGAEQRGIGLRIGRGAD